MAAGRPIRAENMCPPQEEATLAALRALHDGSPIPDAERLDNTGLYLRRPAVSRIIQLDELYRRILPVPGIVIELGVRWGQTLALMHSFRGMYEPYNHTRRIVGFDTFEGFPSVHEADGDDSVVRIGAYGVSPDYERHLQAVLEAHEALSPLGHLRRFELVKGDVTETLPRYLAEHPETIVALAYFDLDLYEPTLAALRAIRPYLTRGSVLGFDELCLPNLPGETRALREALGTDGVRIRRSPRDSTPSYVVVD